MVTAVTERLVGREAEWEAIRAFLEAGEPEPLVLAGDAGIGKTALWAAAVEAATHAGFRVLRARPEEAERELTYAVLADLALPVRDLVHLLPRPQRRALEVALLLQETRGVPPDARAVGAAFLTLLGEAAAREPLLVALDDLQWVDAPSGLVLRYALRRLDRRIGRVLVATRTGEAAIDLPGADTLRIGPLDTRALDLLFEMHLGTSFVAPTLDRIAEASGGNPLYALLLGRELLSRERMPGAVEPLPVSDGLRAVIGRRLQNLPRPVQEGLEIAAALARPTTQLIEAALGEHVDLGAAVAAGVIEDDDRQVRFTHPLYPSAVLGALAGETRRHLHRRLAEIVDDVEERARQLAAGAREPDETVAAAIAVAAARAARQGALTSALGLADRAVELTPPDSRSFVERRLAAAELRFEAGDAAGAEAALSSLVAETAGAERARALLSLGAVVSEREGVAASVGHYESALDAVADAPPEAFVALLHARLALASLASAPDDESLLHRAERAVMIAEDARDPAVRAETLAALAHVRNSRDDAVQSDLLERALELEAETDARLQTSPSLLYAQQYLGQGDVAAAMPLLARAAASARARHDPALSQVLVWLGWAAIRVGDTRHAAELAEEAHVVTRLAGRGEHHRHALPVAAMAYSFLGEVEACRDAAESANRVGESPPAIHMALGLLELSLGNFEEARDLHLQAWRPAADRAWRHEVPTCVEAMAALGEVAAARQLLESAWATGLAPGGILAARFRHARGVLIAAERRHRRRSRDADERARRLRGLRLASGSSWARAPGARNAAPQTASATSCTRDARGGDARVRPRPSRDLAGARPRGACARSRSSGIDRSAHADGTPDRRARRARPLEHRGRARASLEREDDRVELDEDLPQALDPIRHRARGQARTRLRRTG